MPDGAAGSWFRLLDPMERISEILFGIVMALTFTLTLGIATADAPKVRTMLIAALGCNLAWGIIDGGVYLLARLHDQGRKIRLLRAMRAAPDAAAAQRVLAEALPPRLVPILWIEQVDAIRRQARQSSELPEQPALTAHDWGGAAPRRCACSASSPPFRSSSRSC